MSDITTLHVPKSDDKPQRSIEANRLLAAGNDIKDNQLWNHRGSVEVAYNDLRQIPTPEDTHSYTAIGHADFVETLYKHADRLMAPRGFALVGQRYIASHDGARMFFVHSYHNGDSNLQLALAGRNSLDKAMLAAVAVGSKVTVCDNMALITPDGIAIFRRHTGDARGYLNDQIILAMYRASEGWDDLRRERDHMVEHPLAEEEGYALMGISKAVTAGEKSASKRLLTSGAEWKRIQKEWKHASFQYEGGNRTLWAWYNAFTFDFKALKPQDQLQKHASLHAVAKGRLCSGTDCKETTDVQRFTETIERLTGGQGGNGHL